LRQPESAAVLAGCAVANPGATSIRALRRHADAAASGYYAVNAATRWDAVGATQFDTTEAAMILKLKRPGGGHVSVRSEHVLAWAPCSDIGKDKEHYTDLMFPGAKLIVQLSYDEVCQIMDDAA
jgi:hypothetical protein